MAENTWDQAGQPRSDDPLVTFFRHNLWANLRLLDACAALDERQLAATTVGAYGALYDNLSSILDERRQAG